MSGKLPAIKPKELIRVLERKGWRLDRIRGSHHIMIHPVLKKALPVPVHNKDLKPARSTASSAPPALTAELSDLL